VGAGGRQQEEWGVGVSGGFSGEDECPKGNPADAPFSDIFYLLSLLSNPLFLFLCHTACFPCPWRCFDIVGQGDDSVAFPQLPDGWL